MRRRSFHGEIPQRNSSWRRNWIVRPEPSACKVCTKHQGASGRKSSVTKECGITNFCHRAGEENVQEKQIATTEHVQVTAMRGLGWRLVDEETMRPNIEVAVASRNGSYDNDTGCSGRCGKGLRGQGQAGAHVYCLIKVQQVCPTFVCVCVTA